MLWKKTSSSSGAGAQYSRESGEQDRGAGARWRRTRSPRAGPLRFRCSISSTSTMPLRMSTAAQAQQANQRHKAERDTGNQESVRDANQRQRHGQPDGDGIFTELNISTVITNITRYPEGSVVNSPALQRWSFPRRPHSMLPAVAGGLRASICGFCAGEECPRRFAGSAGPGPSAPSAPSSGRVEG